MAGATVPVSVPVAVLITAAGSSSRFGQSKKEFELLEGRPVLDHALAPFLGLSGLAALVLTAPAGGTGAMRAALTPESLALLPESAWSIVEGGATRRDSVLAGLEALEAILIARKIDPDTAIVLIHDGARPWASAALVQRVLARSIERGACIPVVPLADTPKELAAEGSIVSHPERSRFGGAQTPQGFLLGGILAAHRRAREEGMDCTDDAQLWARYNGTVSWVEGESGNRKITFRHDLAVGAQEGSAVPGGAQALAVSVPAEPVRGAQSDVPPTTGVGTVGTGADSIPQAAVAGMVRAALGSIRIGEGWDLHRLVPGRALLLGSVAIDSPLGEDAHSDGDVLWHAVIDAILGACALGDIGSHFPPEDQSWKGADSGALAATVIALARSRGFTPLCLDCTVVLQAPKIGMLRDSIRANLAARLGLEVDRVSVKAKTHEGVDAVGELRAIEARAVILVSGPH